MGKGQHYEERRNARRFQVGWNLAVKGTDSSGRGFNEEGILDNLSSLGAFLYLSRPVNLGERLELQIKIPFKRNNWMKYTAEVVRVAHSSRRAGVGLRFDTAVPVFVVR